MAKVSSGKVVNEQYLHIDKNYPIRFDNHEVANMQPSEHEKFVPKEGQMVRLHHQMAGLKEGK